MLQCEHCHTPVPTDHVNTGQFLPCPKCGLSMRADLFPAAMAGPTAGPSQIPLSSGDDAGCFYHPGKKAEAACSMCGRFLCGLCDAGMDGPHLCFQCLASGSRENRQLEALVTYRFLPDSLALRLSFYPMIIFWLSAVTAPATLYLVFRYWKSESSIVPRNKTWRFGLAFVLATMQIVGWVAGIYYISTYGFPES